MQASDFTKVPPLSSREDPGGDCFVRVQKRDLERLCTEVMQLREFLPKVINSDFLDALHKARSLDTLREQSQQQQQQLKQECLYLSSRLDAAQSECQREREEKLVLRERLWESREQLQQQAEFCTVLGAATCTVLWSASRREEAVRDILADGKLEPFLSVAGQTLESFVKSLDEEEKPQQQNYNSHEHQFVLALAGVITNLAAVTCGRDFISRSAHVLLDTLMQLLGLMKSGVFPKLKVLMLMALYNVSLSVNGLTYISESPALMPLICTLLEDRDSEVCLQALRLLQSLLVEGDVLAQISPDLQRSLPVERIRQLASSRHSALRQTAQEMLEDINCLTKTHHTTTEKEP
ncbi:heat shock factor 2-binding protein [Neoarius graeffei]|uniref:heat shock factor 2-binding protein n=1 Tax=Neoarius graeffei TaxID=443677 RepID=UPI00298CF2E9|nr:heat shock factor 2-binding protein [Neoarius graeffei]